MAVTELLAIFKTQVDTAPLKKGEADVSRLRESLTKLGGIIAGAALVNGFKNMGAEMIGMADDLANTAARLGTSTNDIQQWGFFLQKAGGEASDVEPLFKKLQQNIGSVGGEASKAAPLLKKLLGADYKTEGKQLGEIATDAGLAIGAMTDQNAQAVAAVELFGRSGTKLLPLFRQGRDGMGELNDKFEEFGGGISEDAIGALGDADDALENFDLASRGLKAQMVASFAPALTTVITGAGRLAAAFKSSSFSGSNLRNILIGIGSAAALAGLKAIAPWAALAGALVLAGLLVDDVIVAFKGGDSAVGKLLDRIFGAGVGKSVFKEIGEDAASLVREIKSADSAGEALEKTFVRVGNSLKQFFVSDLPAAIGVATGEMKIADATWADLFDIGGNRKKARQQEKIDAVAAAAAEGKNPGEADAELGKLAEKINKLRARSGTDDAGSTDAFDLQDALTQEQQLVRAKKRGEKATALGANDLGALLSLSGTGAGVASAAGGKGGDTNNTVQASNQVNVVINTTDAEALGDTSAAMQKALAASNKAAAAALTQVGNPTRTSGGR